MGMHVVIQALGDYGAEVVSPSPGVRQLVAGGTDAFFVVQVPARLGGLTDSARFARKLVVAATEFGDWCENQSRTHSYRMPLTEEWFSNSANSLTHDHDK